MDEAIELGREGLRLRVYMGESDHWEGKPLSEEILMLARKRGLAGGTVTRGVAGFGAKSRVHTAKVFALSMDLPVVVEIIDSAEKVRAFLPEVEAMVDDGLATLEPVEVHFYRHKR